MEQWMYEARIRSWAPSSLVFDDIPKELKPQPDDWEHNTNDVRWTPNPEAFEFFPRSFGNPIPSEHAVVMEQVVDEKTAFSAAQAAYEEVRLGSSFACCARR